MHFDLIQRVAPGVRDLHPYQPGKPIEELVRELGLTEISKLASNENPLGCSACVSDVIESTMANLSRYPDGNAFELKKALSTHLGCATEQLLVGNGSSAVLELVIRTFVAPGDEVIYSKYAFILYSIISQAVGAKGIMTPAKDWGHDLDAMFAGLTESTKLICIANPNNPTGTLVSSAELYRFLQRVPSQVIVLLDEAYMEYLPPKQRSDSIAWLNEFENLVVCRTFSKAYGLAGLRIGYGVASAALVGFVNKIREAFNCGSFAQAAATAALQDQAFIERTYALNLQQKALMEDYFHRMGIDFITSAANFLTIDLGSKAANINQRLLAHGVIVRPIAAYDMPHHLRVSIGSVAENKHFMRAFSTVMEQSEL